MKTLIIVDIQNDFLPGGALPVPQGHEVIPIINSIEEYFDLILATKDWHPHNHISFAKSHGKKPGDSIEVKGIKQELWPEHCVQNTFGAEFSEKLKTDKIEKVFHKGINADIDSYSTFFDNAHLRSTGLGDYLNKRHVKEIYIAGLATDYCVRYSVLDAIKLGFKTYIIIDGCRGINLKEKDVEKALEDMKKAGAQIVTSSEIIQKQKKSTRRNLIPPRPGGEK